MSAPGVSQLGPLAELFAIALAHAQPRSVAILGIAGGNGLSAINPEVTRRVVAIDIHPDYLEATAARYAHLPGLELHAVDLARERLRLAPVALVHAALILEHAGTDKCLENALNLVEPSGRLSVLLQLPSDAQPGVSATPFSSLQALSAGFRFVEVPWLCAELAARGFILERESHAPVASGKAFWLGIFVRLP
ncbi:MAG: hypothetical protein K2X03_20035 [Bryobacteraceae bacterium]|nr:hypothetical protein [Bryobacteraceae bacterium]